jgi:xanthine dehydrogenase accessory factor
MDYLDHMKTLRDLGQPFVLATVVRIERPTSAKPGARAIVTQDGAMTGWVGGSCVEPSVRREAVRVLKEGNPRLLRICPPEKMGTEPQDGVIEVSMTCMSGGTLEIYLEPHLTQPHLVVFGHQALAEALVSMGKTLEYAVTVLGENLSRQRFPAADRIVEGLQFDQFEFLPNMYVVVASHGNYDELALEAALPSKAAYVTLVASKKRAESIRTYLSQDGLSSELLGRLKYPAGFDFGASTPPEIALSILAEIIQLHRHGQKAAAGSNASETVAVVAPQGEPPIEPQTAIDPVCGMEVEIATARYKSTYRGKQYYFCAPGCKRSFEKEPETYLQAEPGRD